MNERIDILIADDQKLFRYSISSVLKEFNIHTIGEAGNGKELLVLVETKIPDVILLDVDMPLMNGGEALDILTKEKPDIRIIILSQYDDETLKENFISRGARAFLTKDTGIEILARVIRMVKIFDFFDHACTIHRFSFTKREIEIISMVCAGKSTKEIANNLNVGVKTVEAHRKRIYKKSKSNSIGDFLKIAFKEGLDFLK